MYTIVLRFCYYCFVVVSAAVVIIVYLTEFVCILWYENKNNPVRGGRVKGNGTGWGGELIVKTGRCVVAAAAVGQDAKT